MKNSCRLFLFNFFVLTFATLPATSQNIKMSGPEKTAFSSSVRLIYVWTYATGDSAYRYYDQAWEEARDILSAKGYHTEQVFYKSYLGIPPEKWRDNMIEKLGPGEAFLDLSTLVLVDTTGRKFHGDRVVSFVTDPSGKILAGINQPTTGEKQPSYTTLASATLFAHFPKEQAGDQRKIQSITDSVPLYALDKVVDLVLSKIPYSKNGPVYTGKVQVGNHAEFVLLGGYITGGSINVTGGDVDYLPGGQYGFDVSLGLTRSLDISLQYTRIQTKMNVHSTYFKSNDPLELSLNYFFAGIHQNFRVNRVFDPFVGVYLGGVNTIPKDNLYRDTWYFALQARAGVKFYVTRFFGLILQGNAILQVHPVGAPLIYSSDIYLYPVDADSDLFHFGGSGGIFFRIGR